jgi:hypothetical protein
MCKEETVKEGFFPMPTTIKSIMESLGKQQRDLQKEVLNLCVTYMDAESANDIRKALMAKHKPTDDLSNYMINFSELITEIISLSKNEILNQKLEGKNCVISRDNEKREWCNSRLYEVLQRRQTKSDAYQENWNAESFQKPRQAKQRCGRNRAG